MEKKWSLILMALCLALALTSSPVEAQEEPPTICLGGNFCDKDVDGWIRDHKRCTDCLAAAIIAGRGIDCDDNNILAPDPDGCGGGDDGDTKTSKKSIPLRLTFIGGGNVQSDGDDLYIDNVDRVGVSAGGHSQPNPAAGIHMGLGAKPRIMRQLFLDISCDSILSFPATDGPPHDTINQCALLPDLDVEIDMEIVLDDGVLGHLPDCEVGNNFCDFGAMVRPYKEACPETFPDGECLDVFTMVPMTTELMSFKLGSPGLTVEVASAVGGDSVFDPGNCLSLHDDPVALAEALCAADGDCNVEVTAYDNNEDGENDEWDVLAMDVTALMCNRQTGTLLGKAILTFGFNAIKK